MTPKVIHAIAVGMATAAVDYIVDALQHAAMGGSVVALKSLLAGAAMIGVSRGLGMLIATFRGPPQ